MVESKVRHLLDDLKTENDDRAIRMNGGECSEYEHTALVHEYNNTLNIIKRLERIIEWQ